MSVQINQYIMIGVRIPFPGKHDDFYEKYESFMEDSAFNSNISHKEGIFCLFDGMNGKYVIIGRVMAKSSDGEYLADGEPIELPLTLTELEQELISESINRNFGIDEPLKTFFVTKYR